MGQIQRHVRNIGRVKKRKSSGRLTLPCDGTRAMNTEQATPHSQNKPKKMAVEEELSKPVERRRGRQD